MGLLAAWMMLAASLTLFAPSAFSQEAEATQDAQGVQEIDEPAPAAEEDAINNEAAPLSESISLDPIVVEGTAPIPAPPRPQPTAEPAPPQPVIHPETLEPVQTTASVPGVNGPAQAEGFVAESSTSALKTNASILETPQAVSVVTRAQMDAQGANTVPQALRYTPGVLDEPNGYDLRYDWLWIRGFNTLGTVWMDGLRLPGDPVSYATPSINPYALRGIEVIKGPASVLYGGAIPGGLVNLISKRPLDAPYHEIEVMTSSFGGVQGSLDFAGPVTEDGKWTYRMIALGKDLGSQIDYERDRQIMVAPSLTYRPNEATELTLYGYYQKDAPDFYSPRFYPAVGTLLRNPNGQIPRDRYFGDPEANEFNRDVYLAGYEFAHDLNETWTVRQNLRYGFADQDFFLALVNPAFAYPPAGNGTTLNRVSAATDDQLENFAVDNQLEARFRTGNFKHTSLFGVDYLWAESFTNFGNGFGASPIDYLDPEYGLAPISVPTFTRSGLQKQEQLGLYLQDQIRYDRWLATLGMRYDISEIDTTDRLAGTPTVTARDEAVTWRAGLTYLFDNGLAPYASFSTAFLPTLGTDLAGIPFDPRTAQQYEVGVKYEPLNGRGLFTVSLFDLTLENNLTPNPVDPQFSVQSGEQRIRGVEIEAKYAVTDRLDMLAAYAYSDSEVLSSNDPVELGQDMLRVPEHQASLWLIYSTPWVDGLSVSGGVRGLTAYQTDATYLPELRIPGRVLVDVGAAYELGKLAKAFEGTTLQVNVSNLFDETYVSQCLNVTGGSCNYGAERTLTARLKYSW
ncbi:MAG: TonB-dependent siderophore receptor [Methyloligella sp. ZOD6]